MDITKEDCTNTASNSENSQDTDESDQSIETTIEQPSALYGGLDPAEYPTHPLAVPFLHPLALPGVRLRAPGRTPDRPPFQLLSQRPLRLPVRGFVQEPRSTPLPELSQAPFLEPLRESQSPSKSSERPKSSGLNFTWVTPSTLQQPPPPANQYLAYHYYQTYMQKTKKRAGVRPTKPENEREQANNIDTCFSSLKAGKGKEREQSPTSTEHGTITDMSRPPTNPNQAGADFDVAFAEMVDSDMISQGVDRGILLDFDAELECQEYEAGKAAEETVTSPKSLHGELTQPSDLADMPPPPTPHKARTDIETTSDTTPRHTTAKPLVSTPLGKPIGPSDIQSQLSTPFVTQASDLQAPFTPSARPRVAKFEIGQEVFLLDASGNSIVCSQSASPALLFNNPATIVMSQILRAEPGSIAQAQLLTHQNLDVPNIFLVLHRYKQVGTDGRPQAAGADERIVYKIIPKDGSGRDRLVPGRELLVEVRFRPGDWVNHLPGDGRKWRALVVGAEVLRGRRVYHINVVGLRSEKALVTDDQVEAVEDNDGFIA